MKKDISFDTEMENGYKEKYKKGYFLQKKKKKKTKQNIRSMALQILNKTDLKAKQITRDNEESYMLIKDSKEQDDQTITDRCA